MLRSSWLAIGLAATACNCESGVEPARTTAPTSVAPASPQRPELRGHARSHFDAASDLQLAIAHGRFSDARDLAHWFVQREPEEPVGWGPYLDELSDAARSVEHARTVAAAGAQLARFGRACSACHEAAGARLSFTYDQAPTDEHTLAAQMRRHQWAAARLWEGVVGPADDAWTEGAQVLATANFEVARTVHEKPNADVFELAERLRGQATQAAAMTDHEARAVFYGEIMQTCTSCHSIVRMHPVVDTRRPPAVSVRLRP